MFSEFQLSALCQESGLQEILQPREEAMYLIGLSQCKSQWSFRWSTHRIISTILSVLTHPAIYYQVQQTGLSTDVILTKELVRDMLLIYQKRMFLWDLPGRAYSLYTCHKWSKTMLIRYSYCWVFETEDLKYWITIFKCLTK